MSLDHLLLWLSAKGEGSWPQFRAAVEELHIQRQTSAASEAEVDGERAIERSSDLPVYHEVRFTLQRLGHVEFDAGDAREGWRVVPPTLAIMPSRDPAGLLCGSRSAALLSRLQELAEVEVLPAEDMPQRVIVRGASHNALTAKALALGILAQDAAPIALLCAIPTVRDPSTWIEEPMPTTPGWVIHHFLPSQLEWTQADREEAVRTRTGLFRFTMKYQRFYYLRWRDRCFKVPVQVGKYAVLGRRLGILRYDAGRATFSVPAICRPPLLVERALVLCSGRLPRFEPSTGRVEYADVPPDVAQLASQLLCQEMR